MVWRKLSTGTIISTDEGWTFVHLVGHTVCPHSERTIFFVLNLLVIERIFLLKAFEAFFSMNP